MIPTLSHTEMAVLLVHAGKRKPLKKRPIARSRKFQKLQRHRNTCRIQRSLAPPAGHMRAGSQGSILRRFYKKVSGILCNSIELGRSERHLPPAADREHACRLAGRERRRLSLLVQSAAADHPHPSPHGLFRSSCGPIPRTRSSSISWTNGCGALPTAAQFRGRPVPPRILPVCALPIPKEQVLLRAARRDSEYPARAVGRGRGFRIFQA